MENPSRKCEICAEAGPNQTKLPRHYIRRKFKAETHLDLSSPVNIPFKIARNKNDKNVATRREDKDYRIVYTKQVIVNNFDTLLYGF